MEIGLEFSGSGAKFILEAHKTFWTLLLKMHVDSLTNKIHQHKASYFIKVGYKFIVNENSME